MQLVPRSLRAHKRATNYRARVIAARRRRIGEILKFHQADARLEQDLLENKQFKLKQAKRNRVSRLFHAIAHALTPSTERFQLRRRLFTTARELFIRSGAGWPEDIIRKIIDEKGSCHVFEIGHGRGAGLKTLVSMAKLEDVESRIRLSGIDIVPTPKDMRVKLRKGNAVTAKFPKSDVIYSVWSLGYMGNIGHLLRKTAEALNSPGIAVLHINSEGKDPRGNGYSVFIQDTAKLAANIRKLKLPGCIIKVKRGFSLDNVELGNDLAVIIERKAAS